MINLISSLDLFGSNIKLRYNGRDQHKTLFGGIITIIISILMCLQVYISGIEILEKNNPEVIFSNQFSENMDRVDIRPDTFTIAFGIQDSKWNHFIDESIYSVKAQQFVRKKQFNQQKQIYENVDTPFDIQLVKCNESVFKVPGTEEKFKKLEPKASLYCINPVQEGLHLIGDFDSDKYSFIRFVFSACKDPTKGCKDTEQVKNALQESFFAMYFSDSVVTPKNYTQPYQYNVRNNFYYTSYSSYKEVQFYMKNNYIVSDVGFIQSIEETKRTSNLNNLIEATVIKEKAEFFTLIIRMEKGEEGMYTRRYKKFQNMLAELGGISKALLFLGFIVSFPVSLLNLNINLIKETFTFKLFTQQDSKNEKVNELNKETNDDSNQIVNLSWFDYILYYLWPFGKTKRRRNTIGYAITRIQNCLDTLYIIHKLHEIDKLKALLLDKNQIKLFEYLPKQRIYLDNNNVVTKKKLKIEIQQEENNDANNDEDSAEELFPDQNRTIQEKATDALMALDKVSKKKQMTKVDYKLVRYIDIQYFKKKILEQNNNLQQQIQLSSQNFFNQQLIQNLRNVKNSKQLQANGESKNYEKNDYDTLKKSNIEENNNNQSYNGLFAKNQQISKFKNQIINNNVNATSSQNEQTSQINNQINDTTSENYELQKIDEKLIYINPNQHKQINLKQISLLEIKK